MLVFYDKRQQVETNQSFSPSAGKPRLVLESWQSLKIPIVMGNVTPLTAEEISLAHDPDYVRGVLSTELPNGFGNCSPAIASSLPWTTGSMASAALHALETGESSASLTSGFHHAGYHRGGGFCTFNGLVIAAQLLRLAGAGRVGILDIDAHYGDGTDDIIRKLNLRYISHWTFGGHHIRPGKDAEMFINDIPNIVEAFGDCDVLLYQAGADPHIEDPLGGTLTTEELRKRDELVFQTAASIGLPVVFNLAGGYQQPIRKVLDIHDNTAIEFNKAFQRNVYEGGFIYGGQHFDRQTR